MWPCHNQGGNQYWLMSDAGEIRRDEACIDYTGQGTVNMYMCHGQGGNQKWDYLEVSGIPCYCRSIQGLNSVFFCCNPEDMKILVCGSSLRFDFVSSPHYCSLRQVFYKLWVSHICLVFNNMLAWLAKIRNRLVFRHHFTHNVNQRHTSIHNYLRSIHQYLTSYLYQLKFHSSMVIP